MPADLYASVQTSQDTAPMSVGVFLVMLAAAVILTLACYGLTALIDARRDDDRPGAR